MSAEPDDLLRKADALMARHRPGQVEAPRYADIPVLDEVVDPGTDGDDPPLLTECVVTAPPSEAQLNELAQQIRETLLQNMQPEIQALIEDRLKERLSPLVERLFTELRDDLQRLARDILDDAILVAIEQELEKRRSGD